MTETVVELRKLTTSDGMVLTDGVDYGKVVYLGKCDKAENWYEITEAEYEKILEEKAEEENIAEV